METTNQTAGPVAPENGPLLTESSPTEAAVWSALRQVMDPELGCNLVDLGLIYDVAVHASQVQVKMTLTTMGCPMHQSLAMGVQQAVLALEGVEAADVEVVWDPPWNPAMINAAGRAQLGLE